MITLGSSVKKLRLSYVGLDRALVEYYKLGIDDITIGMLIDSINNDYNRVSIHRTKNVSNNIKKYNDLKDFKLFRFVTSFYKIGCNTAVYIEYALKKNDLFKHITELEV